VIQGPTPQPAIPVPENVPDELQYVALLFALFVVPRILERFRIPAAVTAVALGAAAGMGFGLFAHDATVRLLATLGIVSLFLFAGLEVNLVELRRELRVLAQHLGIGIAALIALTLVATAVLPVTARPAALVALALLTPSTGFILASLSSLGVTVQEQFWIKSKAIATELVALGALFVVLQSTTAATLAFSVAVLAALIMFVPLAFQLFARRVAPFAPKSEFAFLLMVAVICGLVTLRLGVYYLVGAFVVGLAARRFRDRLPELASDQMMHAVEVFASFFVPFYFFNAGLHLRREDFALPALALGLLLLAVMTPVRIALVALHRKAALAETWGHASRIGVAMLPTLVFTLVIAEILRDRFGLPVTLFGALIVYTLTNTLIPGLTLRPPRAATASAPPTPPAASGVGPLVALDSGAKPS